jgi:hypothetical protein
MLVISAILKILGHSVIEMPKRYAKLEWRHIVMTSNTTREMWKLFERAAPKVKVRQKDVRVLYAREIFTRALADPKWFERIGGQGRNRTADAGLFRAAYRIAEVV